jgi:hypothetical protein
MHNSQLYQLVRQEKEITDKLFQLIDNIAKAV